MIPPWSPIATPLTVDACCYCCGIAIMFIDCTAKTLESVRVELVTFNKPLINSNNGSSMTRNPKRLFSQCRRFRYLTEHRSIPKTTKCRYVCMSVWAYEAQVWTRALQTRSSSCNQHIHNKIIARTNEGTSTVVESRLQDRNEICVAEHAHLQ